MRLLFVFGAGASAAEKAPLIADFLSTAYRLFGDDKEYPEYSRVWKFIRESFSKAITGYQQVLDSFPTIDELFSLIDYCLLTNTSLTRQHNIETIYQIKKDLISLMTLTLKETAKTSEVHTGFLKRHLAVFEGCDIISLNYDTLLDNALAGIVGRDKIDYGFDSWSSYRKIKNQYRLFKLHGSLNWGSCTLCKTITIFDSDIAHKVNDNSFQCNGCSHCELEPVIITPTLLKDYTITSIHNVWNSAFKVISKCNVLVFIGYSLNPSDIAIIHLLKRALSAGKKLQTIIVVDYDVSGNRISKKRFQKIFGDEILYIPDGFQRNLDMNTIIKNKPTKLPGNIRITEYIE